MSQLENRISDGKRACKLHFVGDNKVKHIVIWYLYHWLNIIGRLRLFGGEKGKVVFGISPHIETENLRITEVENEMLIFMLEIRKSPSDYKLSVNIDAIFLYKY